ncbi:MAG: AraC family transcriptional regulator [Oscillospiraceae bacterium]|jgi:AraC-like DNA-binding protein|nr:AraC family transcriptional regulator [Oscillospiraceae bacterium]
MYWIREMQSAIAFIEERLLEELSIEEIARSANSSSSNFQRIFTIVTGITAGDYIRSRRLSLAGKELAESNEKILDLALKYGYETAESFTKAFSRFHGMTPSAAKRRASELVFYAPLSINIDVTGGLIMKRKLIPNVPEIPYDGNNAAFFITLLEATLKGLGEDCDKAKLTALSGEGNRFCWTDGSWAFGNEVTESINETPFETECRVLSAIGWDAKYITVQRDKDGRFMNTGPAQIRRDFVLSIDRGYPVLMRYISHADCDLNVFFGYEDNGERIIGYHYNNGFEAGVSQPADVSTPVTWDDWENNLAGYILLQNKADTASERNTALSAFHFIVNHARKTGEIRGKIVGFAAWESFLSHLENDDFTKCELSVTTDHYNDLETPSAEHRFIIYCDALCQIYARKGALPYYRSLAERFPEWKDELDTAIQALDDCGSYGEFLWGQEFTFDKAGFEKFKTAEARKILADAGREAMQKDMIAVEQFEKILRKEGR